MMKISGREIPMTQFFNNTALVPVSAQVNLKIISTLEAIDLGGSMLGLWVCFQVIKLHSFVSTM